MTLKYSLKNKTIAIIAAHTDDIELGMGATLNQLRDEAIYIHVFSVGTAEQDEFYKSMEVYGFDTPDLDAYPTRNFHSPEWTQRIRDFVFSGYHYDVLFTHSKYSQHLDHRIVGEAVDDIIKEKTIITWEEVHSGKNIPVNMWNEVSSDDMAVKSRAIDCYKSQAKRPYFEGDHIMTMARFRGNQILKDYAEAFNVVRLVT